MGIFSKSNGNSQSAGPAVDARGAPVVDPTANVLLTLEMAVKRQDDLRNQESQHVREIMAIRAEYEAKLSEKESDRLDAVRAVDVQNVNRAAEVSSTQAGTLALQVTATAEAMRNQQSAIQQQNQISLAAALDPIQISINDLRRAQWEQQGQKVAQSEGKDTSQWVIGLVVGIAASVILALVMHFVNK